MKIRKYYFIKRFMIFYHVIILKKMKIWSFYVKNKTFGRSYETKWGTCLKVLKNMYFYHNFNVLKKSKRSNCDRYCVKRKLSTVGIKCMTQV